MVSGILEFKDEKIPEFLSYALGEYKKGNEEDVDFKPAEEITVFFGKFKEIDINCFNKKIDSETDIHSMNMPIAFGTIDGSLSKALLLSYAHLYISTALTYNTKTYYETIDAILNKELPDSKNLYNIKCINITKRLSQEELNKLI